MLDALYKYLILNNNVGVPGVGTFHLSTISAKFDANKNSFSPPVASISFEAGTSLTDKNFYHFLSGEMNITEVDAVRKFQDFAYQLRKDIQSFPFIELIGLGTLKKNALGQIEFKSNDIPAYFPTIDPVNTVPAIAEEIPISQEELAGEATIKRDRWWIWALLLGIAAGGAILYYFLNSNTY